MRWANLCKSHRARDKAFVLLVITDEFPVSTGHQLVLIMYLFFVHPARSFYRLSAQVESRDYISVRSLIVEARNALNLIA